MQHSNNHTYIRDKKNYYRIISETKEEALNRENKRKKLNEQKYGKQKDYERINEGKNDRLAGNAPKLFEDKSMQKAYLHGYYENGSKALDGEFSKGTFSQEQQLEFGILDLKNGVPDKYLKHLKQYPAYVEGRIYQMGKNAYDFTYENGIEYDDYFSVMELMYPEIKAPIFKEGYKARELEYSKSKHK